MSRPLCQNKEVMSPTKTSSASSPKNPSVWVVVPLYNEAEVITEVITGLKVNFGNVLCVDDGSSDDSARLAETAGARVLRHPLNLGQGAALQTGFDYVSSQPAWRHARSSPLMPMGNTGCKTRWRWWSSLSANVSRLFMGRAFSTSAPEQASKKGSCFKVAALMTRALTGLQADRCPQWPSGVEHGGNRESSARAKRHVPCQ